MTGRQAGKDNIMTVIETKINSFCHRQGLSCKWQDLRCNGRRAVIASIDREQHAATLAAASRIKGVRVSDWTCGAGGVWEGYVYLQDAIDGERIDAILTAEHERNQHWSQVYHDCIVDGLDPSTASRMAEALYPTPATI